MGRLPTIGYNARSEASEHAFARGLIPCRHITLANLLRRPFLCALFTRNPSGGYFDYTQHDMFASVKLALLCKFSVSLSIDVHHFRQTQLISTQLPWFPHYSPSSQIKVNLLPTRSQLVRKNSMPKRRMRNVARQSLPCRCPYTTVGTSAATSCRTKSLSS